MSATHPHGLGMSIGEYLTRAKWRRITRRVDHRPLPPIGWFTTNTWFWTDEGQEEERTTGRQPLYPERPGVYVFIDRTTWRAVYVGCSGNLRQRLISRSHFPNCVLKFRPAWNYRDLEHKLIWRLRPKFNRVL